MKHPFFTFGEVVNGYDIPVFNEREVRAAAGILFLGAFTAFMNAFLAGNFEILRNFVIVFFLDFTIRLFVSPRFSPSMILGRIAVGSQIPEYSGAPQKRFAWVLGWSMAVVMGIAIIEFEVRGIFNLVMCTLCLVFMFFESVFGICVGCKMYTFFTHKKAKICPGGVCEYHPKQAIQKVSMEQIFAFIVFGLIITVFAFYF